MSLVAGIVIGVFVVALLAFLFVGALMSEIFKR